VDSRQRIIDGTRELLWQRGYIGTSPRAVQDAAGVGQGSMYHHFRSKAAMATAALNATAEEACTELRTALARDGSPVERLVRYLRQPRQVLRGCRLGQMAQDPVIITDPELRRPVAEAFQQQHDMLRETLRQAQDAGQLAADLDPALAASAVAAVLQGAYTLARAQGSPEPFDQAITGFLQLCGIAIPVDEEANAS
jgi:AcrR family transcriptional regulator